MSAARALAFALVLVSTGSCVGISDPPDPCTGTFDATVSGSGGAPNTAFAGCSFYTADGFFIALGRAGSHQITIGTSGARPAQPTTLTIGSWGSADPVTAAFTMAGTPQRIFYSNSGTLTITETILGRVKGSLTMTMRENATNPVVTATVTANFEAPCAGQTGFGC